MNEFESMDEVQRWLFSALLERGAEVSPRGQTTLELTPLVFSLARPRNRCIASSARRWNMALAVGEFSWHMSASDDVDFVAYYMKRWRQFVDEPTRVRGGCYGRRVFGRDHGRTSQWDLVLRLLEQDPDTRRAVLCFHDSSSVLDLNTKDVSCACTLQFLLRRGRLHAIGHMRSNDAVWGLPYDVFFHTMLQELAAAHLGVELGSYTHMAGSMHIYAKHLAMAREVVASRVEPTAEMTPMDSPLPLQAFLACEHEVRTSGKIPAESATLSKFWLSLLDVVVWHRAVKFPGESVVPLLENSPYAHLTWRRSPLTTDQASSQIQS
ncbi:MAG TPA: thymidylate synthase [Polyangiaceae bacterium]|nr:thymidylate synthase [Polyangiaceae bacterium]